MSKPVFIDQCVPHPGNVVTIGTFDGVHAGHQTLLRRVVALAAENKANAVVVTFDPHPRQIIQADSKGIRLLTTLQERAHIMHQSGIDRMVVIPFTRDFSIISSKEFIRDWICKKIGVDTLVIGYDHHFGRDRTGSINTLRALSQQLGFTVHVVQAHEIGHTTVSSSTIRKLLEEEGDVTRAAELLGRPYEWSGTVVKGDHRGTAIGFPTANLQAEAPRKLLPAKGVYCIEAVLEKQCFRGMMNLGVRPTFGGDEAVIPEVHLFDFDQNIYGCSLTVRFLKHLRREMKFRHPEELVAQLHKDREACLCQ